MSTALSQCPLKFQEVGAEGWENWQLSVTAPMVASRRTYELIYTGKIMNDVLTVYTASRIPSQGTEWANPDSLSFLNRKYPPARNRIRGAVAVTVYLEEKARREKYTGWDSHTPAPPVVSFLFFSLCNFAFLLQVHTEGLKGEQVREIQYLRFCCKDALTYFNCLLD